MKGFLKEVANHVVSMIGSTDVLNKCPDITELPIDIETESVIITTDLSQDYSLADVYTVVHTDDAQPADEMTNTLQLDEPQVTINTVNIKTPTIAINETNDATPAVLKVPSYDSHPPITKATSQQEPTSVDRPNPKGAITDMDDTPASDDILACSETPLPVPKVANAVASDTTDGEMSDTINTDTRNKCQHGQQRDTRTNQFKPKLPSSKRNANRVKSMLARKKDVIFKAIATLEVETPWRCLMLMHTEDMTQFKVGGTSPLIDKLKAAEGPLLPSSTFLNSKKCKEVDMSAMLEKLSRHVNKAFGIVGESPVPSPSKLPSAMSALATEDLPQLDFTDSKAHFTPPVVKRKKSSYIHKSQKKKN